MYKLAKQESRHPDLRWGSDAVQPPTESPVQEFQQHQDPGAAQKPMCAATAMMHGIPSGAASSWQGAACPSIHEHRQWAPPATAEDVILPNPGYRVDANLWHLNIIERAPPSRTNGIFLASCQCHRESSQSKLSLWWSSASWSDIVNFERKHPLRTSPSSSASSKGSSLSPRLFVCGQMASKID